MVGPGETSSEGLLTLENTDSPSIGVLDAPIDSEAAAAPPPLLGEQSVLQELQNEQRSSATSGATWARTSMPSTSSALLSNNIDPFLGSALPANDRDLVAQQQRLHSFGANWGLPGVRQPDQQERISMSSRLGNANNDSTDEKIGDTILAWFGRLDANSGSDYNTTDLDHPQDTVLKLPASVLLEEDILCKVLTWETWRDCFTESERESLLRSCLPEVLLRKQAPAAVSSDQPGITIAEDAVRRVLTGENINHGNPVEHMQWMLSSGVCDPSIVSARRAHRWYERCRFDRLVEQRMQTQLRRCVRARLSNNFRVVTSKQLKTPVPVDILPDAATEDVSTDDEDRGESVDAHPAQRSYESDFATHRSIRGKNPFRPDSQKKNDTSSAVDEAFFEQQARLQKYAVSGNTKGLSSFAALKDFADHQPMDTSLLPGFRLGLQACGVTVAGGSALSGKGSDAVKPQQQQQQQQQLQPPPLDHLSGIKSEESTPIVKSEAPKSTVPRRSIRKPRGPPHQHNTIPLVFTLFRTIRDALGWTPPAPRPDDLKVVSFREIVDAVKREQMWLFECHLCAADYDDEEAFVELTLQFMEKHPDSPPAKKGNVVMGPPLVHCIDPSLDRMDRFYRWVGPDELSQDHPLQSQEQVYFFAMSRSPKKDLDSVIATLVAKSVKGSQPISPSPAHLRLRFQQQEALRYASVHPAKDAQPFMYTLSRPVSGSSDAPSLTGQHGPATTTVEPPMVAQAHRAREHPALRESRPPEVSILTLVRDAAARAPGSVATRPDVTQLLRDSQYVLDSYPDDQLSHLVSGALDRLHCSVDPCVKFDPEQKVWIYVHRDRSIHNFAEKSAKAIQTMSPPRARGAPKPRARSAAAQPSGEPPTKRPRVMLTIGPAPVEEGEDEEFEVEGPEEGGDDDEEEIEID